MKIKLLIALFLCISCYCINNLKNINQTFIIYDKNTSIMENVDKNKTNHEIKLLNSSLIQRKQKIKYIDF